MALDLAKLRKLVSLDENDPLSRFALGKKLFETADSEAMLAEAADHLRFANRAAPDHLATYHVLAQTLLRLNNRDELVQVLDAGIKKASAVTEGMGRDLGPAMQAMRSQL